MLSVVALKSSDYGLILININLSRPYSSNSRSNLYFLWPIAWYFFHFLCQWNNFTLPVGHFSADHSLDSHLTIKFLQIHVNIPFQDNCTYTQHCLHSRLVKIIALILYFTSMFQFKNYQSPNHLALEILCLNPQASHLGLPISHPTSISEYWCIL
jgi:hypothetical protein